MIYSNRLVDVYNLAMSFEYLVHNYILIKSFNHWHVDDAKTNHVVI